MIKFTQPHLIGYGFDVAADRVVRFGKHPEGVYLNTRATYDINSHEYTHFRLRELALEQQAMGLMRKLKKPGLHSIPKWIWVLLAVACIFSCSEINISGNITTESPINDSAKL
jgi:hypothetical protein